MKYFRPQLLTGLAAQIYHSSFSMAASTTFGLYPPALSLSHTHSLSLLPLLTLSAYRSLSPSLTHSLSSCRSLSLSPSLTHSLCPSLSLSLSHPTFGRYLPALQPKPVSRSYTGQKDTIMAIIDLGTVTGPMSIMKSLKRPWTIVPQSIVEILDYCP